MINLPKVSVVTITYGHQDYIIETIKGVLKQNYTGKIEFIISNDNSPDDTDQVISDFFKSIEIPQNFEINYINHATNIGVMPNFYDALTKASGDYIALCDGDDYWTDENKLQKQIDFLEENEDYSLIFHNVLEVDKNGLELIEKWINLKNTEETYTIKELSKGNIIPTVSVVYRNRTFDELDWLDCSPAGDYPMHMYNASNGLIKYLPETMACYRVGVGVWGASSELDKALNTIYLITLMLRKMNFEVEINENFKSQISNQKKVIKNIFYKDFIHELNYEEIAYKLSIKRLFIILFYKIMDKIKSL